MEEPDLDDSLAVDILTYGFYSAWLAGLVGIALWLGFPPLVQLQAKGGTAVAVASGMVFLLVSRRLYDHLSARAKP